MFTVALIGVPIVLAYTISITTSSAARSHHGRILLNPARAWIGRLEAGGRPRARAVTIIVVIVRSRVMAHSG
jgi:hypothetical protein